MSDANDGLPYEPGEYDVLIIGGGPAGLSAALVLGRARWRVAVIDSGEPRNAAASQLNGYLTRDGTKPRSLRDDGRREVMKYGVAIFDDLVVAVEREPSTGSNQRFIVRTRSEQPFAARAVLIATGMRDELPEIEGVRACYGKSVHHCPFCDGWEHRDERLVAYGRSAEKAARLGIMLRQWSREVTVLTDGDELEPTWRQQLGERGIEHFSQRVLRLAHEGGDVQGVWLEGKQEMLPADALFFSSGQNLPSDLAQSLGCSVTERPVVEADDRQRTNVPGVFVAGDANGDVQLAIVAAAEGAIAAIAIHKALKEGG